MIPEELTRYRQWVVYRLETREDGKLTKIPYCARTGKRADVTDPADCVSYEEASQVAHNYTGLGFVLSPIDPFVFIDLDATEDESERALQAQIYERIVSYSELSPSGRGLHIIARGPKFERGKRRKSVEIYSSGRFMTMTGQTYRDLPILDCGQEIASLYEHISVEQNDLKTDRVDDQPETLSDHEICDIAYQAANGQKFKLLWDGAWSDAGYSSQSEADFALINIFAHYCDNREQVRRLFLASELGQRKKARTHPSYVSTMVERSFDRKIKGVDFSAIQLQLDAYALTNRQQGPSNPSDLAVAEVSQIDNAWNRPAGLVGDIADFIYRSSPRPQREVALIGALGLMCGLTGRAYNVAGAGLNLYLFLVGRSGIGKDAISKGLQTFQSQICEVLPSAKTFFGPREIASPQALQRHLAENPCFVSYSSEVGDILPAIANGNGSPNEMGMKRALLSLYSDSGEGKIWTGSIYADKTKNVQEIKAPAFSLIGETTPRKFYSALSEDSIVDGLIPRFLTIEVESKRPELNSNRATKPDSKLINAMVTLAHECVTLNSQNKARNVEFSPEALALIGPVNDSQFNLYCDEQIRAADSEAHGELWNRAHLKAMKLAALLAIGENPFQPVVSEAAAKWARAVVMKDTMRMVQKFATGEIVSGDIDAQQVQRICLTARDWIVRSFAELGAGYTSPVNAAFHQARLIPYSWIQSRNTGYAVFRNDRRGATRAIQDAIRVLVDRGSLREIPRHETAKHFGAAAIVYAVSDPSVLGINLS
ncbi:hypothetical protein [Caudoviricetes sp.]|nr:hypothetical protein [Caudoviricetes sp.]